MWGCGRQPGEARRGAGPFNEAPLMDIAPPPRNERARGVRRHAHAAAPRATAARTHATISPLCPHAQQRPTHAAMDHAAIQ